ncbi:MAG: hypothetical protein DRO39_01730 [Thermoprotei archaeon]|nr:MAG: hypothetical protein DRO39_01730 [Thermoprotei archaeon]
MEASPHQGLARIPREVLGPRAAPPSRDHAVYVGEALWVIGHA